MNEINHTTSLSDNQPTDDGISFWIVEHRYRDNSERGSTRANDIHEAMAIAKKLLLRDPLNVMIDIQSVPNDEGLATLKKANTEARDG